MPVGNYTLSATVVSSFGSFTFNYSLTNTYNGLVLGQSGLKEFFYEGFEENGSATKGSAHSGDKYWNGNYTAAFTLPNGRAYAIQWWNFSGGKWNYNSQAFTGSLALTGPVDDIRIFPADALMSSFTYNPLFGITSQTDPSGKTNTYEYDNLGRLSLVRDQDGNVVKKVCYSYSGQTVSCNFFSNVLKSGTFTRNNCAAGSTGGSVTYTVPAGTYFSAASQLDADAKAQSDVDANGQAYANTNGVCTWLSVVKSGTFTRNNCAAGGSGGVVTYTVAAGAYNSTISQADADSKAQNDVNTNGQSYANANGTCTWLSVVKSGSFTRNNCTTGETGSTVTYTVVAGAYNSTISQADADSKAQNDVNTNGQSYANTHGTCTPLTTSITSTVFGSISGFKVTFTNTSTLQAYQFTIPASGGSLGTIPLGIYNITISKTGNTTTYYMSVNCDALATDGTSATFNNVTINASTCTRVHLDTRL
jgi:YD repeat-containing protein